MAKVARARVPGPLAPFADGFRVELDRLGYTASSRESKVNQMACLSRWLDGAGLGVGDIYAARVEMFLAAFGATRERKPTVRSMAPLLDWLRAEGAVGPEPAVARSPLDELIDDYHHWMVNDRNLAGRTMERYEETARRFLETRAEGAGGGLGVDGLSGEAVGTFLLSECSGAFAVGTLKGRVAELRSLLRFLYLQGLTNSALAGTVPPVAGWKDTTVPPRLAAEEVRVLLDSCDRSTATGRRDLAILVLLARLGLRAAEVAGLELEDLHWRAGEVVVRGKGRREDRLPLPDDVGAALAAYLSEGRPLAESRTVFLTLVAPWRPMWSTAISQTVWRQCARAGLTPVRSHRLRHALASHLLDQGVRLSEISQVLRHRDLATTAVYAKVDHASLRELARPWPVVTL